MCFQDEEASQLSMSESRFCETALRLQAGGPGVTKEFFQVFVRFKSSAGRCPAVGNGMSWHAEMFPRLHYAVSWTFGTTTSVSSSMTSSSSLRVSSGMTAWQLRTAP